MTKATRDHWAEWLLERRHGGDTTRQQQVAQVLLPVRDRVLENARITPGDTVLDVGAGDGIIAFGALERVGSQGAVIFSDISSDLLDYCRQRVIEFGALDRCRFVQAGAEDLSAIPNASADAVTTRSVLIYVSDKQRAFDEFHRILKPGGRLSIFEPINGYFGSPPYLILGMFDGTGIPDITTKIRAAYERHGKKVRAMLDFNDHDLLSFIHLAGFHRLEMDLNISCHAPQPVPWEVALKMSGNPLQPTLGEIIDQALTPAEAAAFTAHLQPLVESGRGVERRTYVYAWAVKG